MIEGLEFGRIPVLQAECIIRWKESGVSFNQKAFYSLVEENHAFNYQLWHAEDNARRDDMGSEYVYRAKRAIDGFNQERNNRMEAMDAWIFNAVQPSSATDCPLHSETPGMMIDRLSILALKSYHMALQVKRQDVDDAHRERCRQKLSVIEAQLSQLSLCLQQFGEDLVAKRRTFKIYHQCKMYNDPTLNPAMYSRAPAELKLSPQHSAVSLESFSL